MQSVIELMGMIATLRSIDLDTRERARHLAWHFAHRARWPNGLYRGLRL